MHTLRTYPALIAILLLLALAACSPSPAAAPSTPTLPSGGGDSSGSSASAGDAGGSQDAATGLDEPAHGSIPNNTSPPSVGSLGGPPSSAAEGTGTIAIGGELPLMLTGGTCEQLDGDTYLSIPTTAGAPPPYVSLIIFGGEGLVRSGQMVWATSEAYTDGAVVSAQDTFVITLNGDGFSGRFEGTAHRGSTGVPVQVVIPVNGVFNCVAGLVRVGGEHPMDMTGARCEMAPSIVVSGGRPGENAVLLTVEEGATSGTPARGGISWRVGGVQYTTNWLYVNINSDALSGSYTGEARRPDGSTFIVEGTFNCMGR